MGVPSCGQNPCQNETPTLQRFWVLYSVTWPLHDDHAPMHQVDHLISRPPHQQATSSAGLGLGGSNPHPCPSFSIVLWADPALIAPQMLYAYLLSFLVWRLTGCTPVCEGDTTTV